MVKRKLILFYNLDVEPKKLQLLAFLAQTHLKKHNETMIAPICPHAMSYRPLVVPGSVRIEVTLRSLTEEAYLTLDGQVGFPMRQGDAIVVDRHPRSVRLLRVASRGFFEVLQRKLHWGGR